MSKAFIKIQHLSKIFCLPKNSEHHALRDITFSIEKGDIYGIVGMSGAGKSTLLRCLSGLEKPSTGSIRIDGKDIGMMNQEELRQYRAMLGMVFQHFNLFPSRTAEENIAFPLEIHGAPHHQHSQRVAELLDLVGLAHKKDAYPAQLSGGEKQRIGIARALANNPSLLLCDEATSALDTATGRSILDLLKRLNQQLGLTIVLITHQLEAVQQICSKVAVLGQGELIEEGEVQDIFSNPLHQTTRLLLGKSLLQSDPLLEEAL